MKKERQSALRKAKTRLARCEEEIEEAENETAHIEEKMQSAPYEELMELTKRLDELTAEKERLYSEWETLSEQLTEENS